MARREPRPGMRAGDDVGGCTGVGTAREQSREGRTGALRRCAAALTSSAVTIAPSHRLGVTMLTRSSWSRRRSADRRPRHIAVAHRRRDECGPFSASCPLLILCMRVVAAVLMSAMRDMPAFRLVNKRFAAVFDEEWSGIWVGAFREPSIFHPTTYGPCAPAAMRVMSGARHPCPPEPHSRGVARCAIDSS